MSTPTDTEADPYADLTPYQFAEPAVHPPRLCVCGEWSWDLRTGRCLECRCTIAGLRGAPAPIAALITTTVAPETAPAAGDVLPVRVDGQTSTTTATVLAVDPAAEGTHAVLTLAVA